ncbi:L-threonylcarbamoyladenylate synthase [Desulfoluna spongiiphila]|uniref:L-threonylcarbamoyladenylate synthase n=1 Tax=Desulfoluna spongiiphila TaxID=419481 RepID=A0A1G5ADC5_9BACT|nr:L-threonylcarbamoyladenylate synthase [Desulfoluna spongiiphila]SCX75888.1 L-threonylcarbamoyladenylate synthase [Desulfoluna spongiiphila]
MGTRLPVHTNSPSPETLGRVADILTTGGCVVIPTFCLYGLAASAFDEAAVKRVFAIKERPLTNPILLLIKDRQAVDALVTEIPPAAEALMARLWPGKLTLVFNAHPSIPDVITAGTGKVGLRVPSHPVARAVAGAVPFPITGTSANISCEGGVSDPDKLDPRIVRGADLVLDAGPLHGGSGSTVVDVTCSPVRILREGSTPAATIHAILNDLPSF